MSVKIRLSLDYILSMINGTGLNYVTAKRVSMLLGVSTKSAGRILARLEDEGFIERYSNRAYRVKRSKLYSNDGI
ncbi:MAG: hypothetical protein QXT23_01975 [Acidilobaceae archaeon]